MIVIAGAGPKMEKFKSTKTEHCYHCRNNSRWILQKTRYFITLFFLPVVPFRTEYLYYCPICGYSKTLTKKEFEQKVLFEAEPLGK